MKAFAVLLSAMALALSAADAPTAKTEPVPVHKANYELATHWTQPRSPSWFSIRPCNRTGSNREPFLV